MPDNQTNRELTDGDTMEMARKSRFMRELDERDARSRLARGAPPPSPSIAGADGAETTRPKMLAGGAGVRQETANER